MYLGQGLGLGLRARTEWYMDGVPGSGRAGEEETTRSIYHPGAPLDSMAGLFLGPPSLTPGTPHRQPHRTAVPGVSAAPTAMVLRGPGLRGLKGLGEGGPKWKLIYLETRAPIPQDYEETVR